MIGRFSTRAVWYATLGVASFLLSTIGLQILVPRSATLQGLFHASASGGATLADGSSSCVVAKKDLKNEVFFVSCGGFF